MGHIYYTMEKKTGFGYPNKFQVVITQHFHLQLFLWMRKNVRLAKIAWAGHNALQFNGWQ